MKERPSEPVLSVAEELVLTQSEGSRVRNTNTKGFRACVQTFSIAARVPEGEDNEYTKKIVVILSGSEEPVLEVSPRAEGNCSAALKVREKPNCLRHQAPRDYTDCRKNCFRANC